MGLMGEFARILDIEQMGSKVISSPDWQKAHGNERKTEEIILGVVREYYGDKVDLKTRVVASLVKDIKHHVDSTVALY